jgi:hypothetical protein
MATDKPASLPLQVKLRNTLKEQITSASPLGTDVFKRERHVGKVPISDIVRNNARVGALQYITGPLLAALAAAAF